MTPWGKPTHMKGGQTNPSCFKLATPHILSVLSHQGETEAALLTMTSLDPLHYRASLLQQNTFITTKSGLWERAETSEQEEAIDPGR